MAINSSMLMGGSQFTYVERDKLIKKNLHLQKGSHQLHRLALNSLWRPSSPKLVILLPLPSPAAGMAGLLLSLGKLSVFRPVSPKLNSEG